MNRLALLRRAYIFANRPPFSSSPSTSTATSSNSTRAPPLNITQRAAEQLRRISGPGEHLRIWVDSGGCSGFEYKLTLDNWLDANDDEVIRVAEGSTVVVDKLSLEFLHGAKLDYSEDLMRSAFRIMDNPQATQGCSCGASFAPKEPVNS